MNKGLMIKKAGELPHVFCILPIDQGQPETPGTWATYPFDDIVQFWINTSHQEAISLYRYIIKQEEIYKMTKALTIKEEDTVRALIKNNMRAIQSVLPKHLTPEKAARLLFGLLVKNPAIGRCTQTSIMNCFLEASTLGLEIGGALHHASLIPFKNEATLVIEYNGKIMLANNTGNVKNVSAYAVYQNDEFSYTLGLNPDIIHIPSDDLDPGPLVYAYAVINYLNGGQDFEVITRKIAMEAKARSAAKNAASSPWNQKDMEYQQWKKTAIHRLMNRVPKSAEKLGQAPVDGYVPNRLENFNIEEIPSVKLPEKPVEKKQKPAVKKVDKPKEQPEPELPVEYSKEVKQLITMRSHFPAQFSQAMVNLTENDKELGLNSTEMTPEKMTPDQALAVGKEVEQIVDIENQ